MLIFSIGCSAFNKPDFMYILIEDGAFINAFATMVQNYGD